MAANTSRRESRDFRILSLKEIVEAHNLKPDDVALKEGQTWESLLQQVLDDAAREALKSVKDNRPFDKSEWLRKHVTGHPAFRDKWTHEFWRDTRKSLSEEHFGVAVAKVRAENEAIAYQNLNQEVQSHGPVEPAGVLLTAMGDGIVSGQIHDFEESPSQIAASSSGSDIVLVASKKRIKTAQDREAQDNGTSMATRFKSDIVSQDSEQDSLLRKHKSGKMAAHHHEVTVGFRDTDSTFVGDSKGILVRVTWMDDNAEPISHLNGAIKVDAMDSTVNHIKSLIEEDIYNVRPYDDFGMICTASGMDAMILHKNVRCEYWLNIARRSRQDSIKLFLFNLDGNQHDDALVRKVQKAEKQLYDDGGYSARRPIFNSLAAR